MVVFDLDGVLLDSREANYEAFAYAMERLGRRRPSKEDVVSLIGLPAREILLRLGCPELEVTRAFREWVFPRYVSCLPELVRPVRGAYAVLRELQRAGVRIGACTSGGRAVQDRALKVVGLREFFEYIQTPDDSVFRKPDPRFLGELVFRFVGESSNRQEEQPLGIQRWIVFHVEDMGYGVRMGREFGAVTVFASYGYGDLDGEKPDLVLRELENLPELIFSYEDNSQQG